MSLRSRLILSHISIVLLCLIVITVTVWIMLSGYATRITQIRLNDLVKPIYLQTRNLVLNDADFTSLWASVKEQAQENNIVIIMIDVDGYIVKTALPNPNANENSFIVPPASFPSQITEATQGVFTASSGTHYVYAAYPLGRSLSGYSEISDTRGMVVAVPSNQGAAIFGTIIKPFFWIGLFALIVSTIVAWFLAHSVYKPVKQLTQAAEDIAQGNYDSEITVSGPKEIKNLAGSFNNMSKQVKQAQERLRHFVADVSHQLKSPLTSIQGFAQAITDGTATDKSDREKAAGIIHEESRKMMRQVDELLELSRMQSGQTKMDTHPTDINKLLEQCVDIFSLRLQEKQIEMSVETDALPDITADPDRLEQVFGNLLDNAIKNSPRGSHIKITTLQHLKGIEIRIADDGPGIHPEQLPYVFERFYQAIGVRTGVGLGLAIAKEIILAHNGTIRAESEPGKGTEFIITLPINDKT